MEFIFGLLNLVWLWIKAAPIRVSMKVLRKLDKEAFIEIRQMWIDLIMRDEEDIDIRELLMKLYGVIV